MSKQYTPVRKVYAWVGFLTIIVGIVFGIKTISQSLHSRDMSLMQKEYCHVMRDDGTVFAWEC